ncbi:MAG TPA: hypothetical protein VHD32_16645 [Candidatus Didemnitutus sp.]|nr:hypothetical protein [Candidatus Didemnitutus sp.]
MNLSVLALLVLTPKCLLCVIGYFGLGALLGIGGPEICGASSNGFQFGISPSTFVCVFVGTTFVW